MIPSDKSPGEPMAPELPMPGAVEQSMGATAEQPIGTAVEQPSVAVLEKAIATVENPAMSAPLPQAANLVDLLSRFLQVPGHVLLIQGPPGSGKTTLALEVLNRAEESHKIYTSSRVSPTRLRQHFPWIDEVLDAMSGRTAKASWIDELHDMRTAEPDSVFSKVIGLKHARRRAVLVVDSWEGALRNTNDEGRRMLEAAILSELDESKVSVIVVTEGEGVGGLSYLVDGVVTLSQSEEEGRMKRVMVVKKLRGFRVRNPRGLFSLEGGRFKLLPPALYSESLHDRRFFLPVLHSKSSFSTGSPDLDSLMGGGVKKGSFLLIDMDSSVSPDAMRVFFDIIQANFLNQGGSCFIVPVGAFSPESIAESLRPYVGDKALEEKVRIVDFRPPILPRRWKVQMKGKILEDLKTVFNSWHELETHSSARMLNVNLDKLEQVYGEDQTLPGFSEIGEELRDSGALYVSVASRHTKVREEFLRIADYHLKIRSMDDSFLMFGVKPFTPLYGGKFNFEKGYPTLKLTELV